MRTLAVCLLGLAATASAGCNVSPPRWFSPGSAPYQQRRAERFDPYPEPDIAPEVVGGRPREFNLPRSEPVRTHNNAAASYPFHGRDPNAPVSYGPRY